MKPSRWGARVCQGWGLFGFVSLGLFELSTYSHRVIHACLDQAGCIWVRLGLFQDYLGLLRCICVFVPIQVHSGLLGFVRACLGSLWFIWGLFLLTVASLGYSGFSCFGLSGLIWAYLGLSGLIRASLGSGGLIRGLLDLFGSCLYLG